MSFFLSFSDAAKFADIARNIVSGRGYGGNFSFWHQGIEEVVQKRNFPAWTVPPVMPYSIAAFLKFLEWGILPSLRLLSFILF